MVQLMALALNDSGSNRSSSDASLASEVDDVISDLCNSILMMNDEPTTTATAATTDQEHNRIVWRERLAQTARSGHSVSSFSDPGPLRSSNVAIVQSAGPLFEASGDETTSGNSSASDNVDEVINGVNWSLFEVASPEPARHSKSAPNLKSA